MARIIDPLLANKIDPLFGCKTSISQFLLQAITFPSQHEDVRMMNETVHNGHSDIVIEEAFMMPP
jgi:hypothetical protein